jgi:hypothetical protein
MRELSGSERREFVRVSLRACRAAEPKNTFEDLYFMTVDRTLF